VDNADEITVELVQEPTDDVRALVGELDRILSAEYTPEQRHGLPLDAIFKPDIRFFLARSKGAAVGCGGVAFFADFAELKRMYVRDVARGSGAAWALLARIEREAREAGFACSGWRREHVRPQHSVSMSERGFNPAQHSAPT
jgi:putative acetyltransferase